MASCNISSQSPNPLQIFVTLQGGTTFSSRDVGPVPQFFLGGPLRLGAYGTNELYGNQYYLVRLGYLPRPFTLPPFLGKKIYAIGSYEFAKMYGFPNESASPTTSTAASSPKTALGRGHRRKLGRLRPPQMVISSSAACFDASLD